MTRLTSLTQNARVGFNHSLFQIAIDMPQSPYNYVTGVLVELELKR